ncbi:MAG: 1-acyl-sn-glycerol-3-phosphate acyltransferase, partial [Lachnospiraceae bacterium]|nr:1-acyl-sn-glycerol-3-phosphate acyltransferase [Lachnospiraceae bacterium]
MKKISFLKRMLLPQKQLEQYYRSLRQYEYENDLPIKGINVRKMFHGLILVILRIECLFLGVKVEIVGDKRTATSKPLIYACTHIGRYDVESNFLALKNHFYVFYGDPGKVYRSINGLLLYINGVIYTETDSKNDRRNGKEKCIKLLKKGGNLLIYPEGAWNITENETVMRLFTGVIEMAILSNAEIIPIAMENYENNYHVNIGKNINCSKMTLENKREYANNLRDIMCTLKWEIWEKEGIKKRSDISIDYSEKFQNKIMSQTIYGYTVEKIIKRRFKDKSITTKEEAFAFM